MPTAVLIVLASTVLAGCGSDDGNDLDPTLSGKVVDGFDAASISGDVGVAPEVDWQNVLDATKEQKRTVVEGDGEAVKDGGNYILRVWVGNGTTQTESFSNFAKTKPAAVTSTGQDIPPVTFDDLLFQYAGDLAETGVTMGSRIEAVVSAEDAFGDYASSLTSIGIGTADSLVFVVDVIAPFKAPTVVEKGGTVSGLDFSGSPKQGPANTVVTYVTKGDGEPLTPGSKVAVKYLGALYPQGTVFDQNFSGGGKAFTFTIGAQPQAEVIQGWDAGLQGVPVGSRVVLSIPSELAYGPDGSPPSIPANAPLAFVIDVVKAKAAVPSAG